MAHLNHEAASIGECIAGLHCRNDTLTYRDTTALVLPGNDQMRVFWQPIASQAETRLFASILTIAALLLAFGLLAEEVIEGETLSFDRKLLLAVRQAGNPGSDRPAMAARSGTRH